MNIVLIGYRATGKTSVARELARHTGWQWIDSDEQIEQRAKRTIAEIFSDLGETGFRDLETEVIANLSASDQTIIAVGGGSVLRESNRDHLARDGQLVWLKADPETIFARMTNDPHSTDRRPNLTNSGGKEEIVRLLDERQEIYRQSADLEVDTEHKTPSDISLEILSALNFSVADRHDP